MGSIADTYDAMRAVGRSPDRSVTLTLTGRGQVEVELDPDVRFTHSEAQLARQIAGAARIAIAAFQQEQARAIAQAVAEAQPA
ncbi:YbaB/EbfC family nucleoid-associated protein [Plantactinospora sp. WMMC1484]|uniref:YbaB/EbfC family nucleoid-associated protein n=1 Tax=Plantactinospora sp. WMMC1484 TaxID=3404122 RepID=UPI003BF53A90